MAPHRKCKFQPVWLNEEEKDENGDRLVHYIIPDNNDVHRAICTVCSKNINVACMGKAALIQHARGDIHKEKMKIRKGESKQRQLPFQKKDSSTTNDAPTQDGENPPEVEVVHVAGHQSKASDFTISVAKDPASLTEPFSQQVSDTNHKL